MEGLGATARTSSRSCIHHTHRSSSTINLLRHHLHTKMASSPTFLHLNSMDRSTDSMVRDLVTTRVRYNIGSCFLPSVKHLIKPLLGSLDGLESEKTRCFWFEKVIRIMSQLESTRVNQSYWGCVALILRYTVVRLSLFEI